MSPSVAEGPAGGPREGRLHGGGGQDYYCMHERGRPHLDADRRENSGKDREAVSRALDEPPRPEPEEGRLDARGGHYFSGGAAALGQRLDEDRQIAPGPGGERREEPLEFGFPPEEVGHVRQGPSSR